MAGNTEKLGRLLADLDRRVGDLETYPQLRYSSVDDFGVPVLDADGNIVARLGKQSDGTWGAPPLAGPVPTEPKGISAIGAAGGVEIEWQGATVSGTLPLDFDAVEILADDAIVGAIHNGSGGRIFVPLPAGQHRITARTRTSVPVYSAAVAVETVEIAPPATVLAEQLAEGLATASRSNTVSATTPGLADGYPEGAVWTRVESVDGALVAADRWMIVDGAWAPVGLDASTLVTGTVDAGLIDVVALAAALVTSGLIRTGATGQRLELTSAGLVLYGVDPDGAEYEMVRLGPSGAQLLTIGRASIDSDGDMTGRTGTFNAVEVGGRTLPEILSDGPRGLVAWGRRTSWTNARKSRTRIIEVAVELQPQRLYRITTTPITAQMESASYVKTKLLWYRSPYTDAGVASVKEATSWVSGAGLGFTLPGMTAVFSTGPDGMNLSAPADFGFILTSESPSSPHLVRASGDDRIELVVEDMGPSREQTATVWQDPAESGTSTGTVVVGTTRRTLHRDASSVMTYVRGGAQRPASGQGVQGQVSGQPNREGAWYFPDVTSALSGSTVESVTLRVWVDHTYASTGATARFHLHGLSAPGATAGLTTYLGDKAVKRDSWVTWTITDPTICAGFKSGQYRGFGLSSSSTSTAYYLRANADADIDIVYRK